MRCPECRSDLVRRELTTIPVDQCGDCEGIWFDSGELDSYRVSLGKGSNVGVEVAGKFEPDCSASPLDCPSCGIQSLREGKFHDYVVAQCARCAGLFIGKWELSRMSANLGRNQVILDAAEAAPSVGTRVLEYLFALLDGT